MKFQYEFSVNSEDGDNLIHLVIPAGSEDILMWTKCDDIHFDENGLRVCIYPFSYMTSFTIGDFGNPYLKSYTPPKENVEYELDRDLLLRDSYFEKFLDAEVALYQVRYECGELRTRYDLKYLQVLKSFQKSFKFIKDFLNEKKDLAKKSHKKFENYHITFQMRSA